MGEAPRIHSWPCSYYLDSSRRWIPGQLCLTPVSIRFTADGSRQLLLDSRLSGIGDIRKESSQLIFSSLTILDGGTKHWFSSLQPSRNAVFNVLEHFWREQLLPGREGGEGAAGKGRELVGMLEGSQKSLEDTARVLHAQGEQFDNVLRGLHKIEGDMDVADRLLTELESPSWWPFSSRLWKTPPEAKPAGVAAAAAAGAREGLLLRIPAILAHDAKPGQLALLPAALEIWDGRSQLVQRLEARDVDSIRVHSPYEISVRQNSRGKGGRSYRLLAARMPRAIPILRAHFSGKLQFLQDALGFAGAGASPPAGAAATGLLGAAADPGIPAGSEEGLAKEQLQVQKVSQEEATELRQILRKLKGLALETEAELERQDEALDCLGSAVERATLTIERQNRRMRRLT